MGLRGVSFYGGLTLFILAYEFNFKPTKYLLSISSFIFILIMFILVFFSYNLYFNFSNFLMLFLATIGLIVLTKYTKVSQLEYKTISSYTLLGIIFLGYGFAFSNKSIWELNVLPIWVQPLLYCIGAGLIGLPLFTPPKSFDKTFRLWSVLGVFTFIVFILFNFIYVIFGFPLNYIFINIYLTAFLLYMINLVLKDLRSFKPEKLVSKDKESQLNILGVFAKPQRLTEEEVSISKEKKICLVCKGELSRKIYICPECKAFYCIKCADALVNVENACWVCNTPFDEFKLAKPFENYEIKAEVEFESKDKKV